MKIIAVILLASVAVLTGQYYAHRLFYRVRLLGKIELMLNAVLCEVNYLATPASEIVLKLSKRTEFNDLYILDRCINEIASGVDFRTAWSFSLNNPHLRIHLKERDISLLESFGNAFGTTDAEGQKSICLYYIEEIADNLKDARDKKERYGGLLTGLGFLFGIGVIIVFI